MSDSATYEVPLGIGDQQLLVPAGWGVIEIGGGILYAEEPEGGVPNIAAGVAEQIEGRFAANVLLYRGHDGIDAPPEAFGNGQLWHDSTAEGPVQRVSIRFSQIIGYAIVTVHIFATVDDHDLLVVVSLPSDRLAELWPTAEAVVGSVVGDLPATWGGWF